MVEVQLEPGLFDANQVRPKYLKVIKHNCARIFFIIVFIFFVYVAKFSAGKSRSRAMVDLGGYVIILVETKDKKIKLYGTYLLHRYILIQF